MTIEDVDDEVATAARECDERFDSLQPKLMAALRAEGVREADLPGALARAHAEYWRTSRALLDRLRGLLLRVQGLHP